MERGPLYKKTPFKMKGYSYPGKSPVQKNYFKTDLFTNPNIGKKDDPSSGDQSQYITPSTTTTTPTTKPTVNATTTTKTTSTEDKTNGKKSKKSIRGMDPELALAVAHPLGYIIGKGLTRLFGGKSKKQEIAEAGQEQEKKMRNAYDKGARTQRVSDMGNEEYLEYIKLDKKGRDEYLKKNPTRKKSKKTNTKIKPKHETRLGPMIVGENK